MALASSVRIAMNIRTCRGKASAFDPVERLAGTVLKAQKVQLRSSPTKA